MLIVSSSCDKLWYPPPPFSNWTTIVLCTPTFCSCTCLFTARLHLQTSSLLHHGNEWPSQSNWIWTAVPHLEPSCLTQIISSSSPPWSLVPPPDAEMPTWIELQPDVVFATRACGCLWRLQETSGGCWAVEKVVVEVTNWGRLYQIQAVQGNVDLL